MAKDDEQILFPDVVVAGYTVRPWTLGQAVDLADALGSIVDIIGKSGVGGILSKILESIDPEDTTLSGVAKTLMSGWKDIVRAIPATVPRILPYAPKILSVSLSLSVEEVSKFDLGKTTELLKVVAIQNWDYLKNYYGPGKARREAEVA